METVPNQRVRRDSTLVTVDVGGRSLVPRPAAPGSQPEALVDGWAVCIAAR